MDLRFAVQFFAKPGNLVDLGCGTGRLLMPLANSGFSVLGIDLSAEMLAVAAEKARACNAGVPLLRANLVELDCVRDQSFDYAACLFSTLGIDHSVTTLNPTGVGLAPVPNALTYNQVSGTASVRLRAWPPAPAT